MDHAAERQKLIQLIKEAEDLGDFELVIHICKRCWKLVVADRDKLNKSNPVKAG